MEINRKVHRFVKRCAIRTNLCVAPHEKASAQGRAPEAIKARTRLVRFPVTFRTAFQVTKKKKKEKKNSRELLKLRTYQADEKGERREFFQNSEKKFILSN